MYDSCRGDFWISSYWLVLTHKFKSTTDLLFFQKERGEVRKKKPYFLRDQRSGGWLCKGKVLAP